MFECNSRIEWIYVKRLRRHFPSVMISAGHSSKEFDCLSDQQLATKAKTFLPSFLFLFRLQFGSPQIITNHRFCFALLTRIHNVCCVLRAEKVHHQTKNGEATFSSLHFFFFFLLLVSFVWHYSIEMGFILGARHACVGVCEIYVPCATTPSFHPYIVMVWVQKYFVNTVKVELKLFVVFKPVAGSATVVLCCFHTNSVFFHKFEHERSPNKTIAIESETKHHQKVPSGDRKIVSMRNCRNCFYLLARWQSLASLIRWSLYRSLLDYECYICPLCAAV